MAKWPLVGDASGNRINGQKTFAAFGGSHRRGGDLAGDQVDVQQEVRDTYTASNLRVFLSNFVGADVTFTFRVNVFSGTQVVTATATGEFEDITNTDSLVSGDVIVLILNLQGGMHGDAYNLETFQTTLDAVTAVPPIMAASSWSASATVDFAALQGAFDDRTTEADVEYTMRAARTLRDMRIFVISFTATDVVTMRKNRANGNLTVTATGTGEFLDTTNTDSFVDGDEANYGSDGGNIGISVRSVEADSSSGVQMWADTSVGASTEFFAPSSDETTTTEANAEIEAEANDVVIQNLFINCFTFAETRTIRTRINRANGNASVSVTGTGLFEDLTNIDQMVAEDDLSIQQDAGTTGTNGYLIAVEWGASLPPGLGPAAQMQESHQQVNAVLSRY